jgi:predicted TIM-barrel fold metal-dependent hydrolase
VSIIESEFVQAALTGRIRHIHIIDHRFPLIENQGYLPPPYSVEDYLREVQPLGVVAGTVVSGSFKGYDQTYLEEALAKLGPNWVGVAQIPHDFLDEDIQRLSSLGVRGLRFNLFRGSIDSVDEVVRLATRCHSVAGWHAEMYVDAATLKPHVEKLSRIPQLSIDHLGMTEAGIPVVLELIASGCKVKASGFGRVELDVPHALERFAKADSSSLIFGTGVPSTRAKRPFEPSDIDLIEDVLGSEIAARVLWDNPIALYRLDASNVIV